MHLAPSVGMSFLLLKRAKTVEEAAPANWVAGFQVALRSLKAWLLSSKKTCAPCSQWSRSAGISFEHLLLFDVAYVAWKHSWRDQSVAIQLFCTTKPFISQEQGEQPIDCRACLMTFKEKTLIVLIAWNLCQCSICIFIILMQVPRKIVRRSDSNPEPQKIELETFKWRGSRERQAAHCLLLQD